MSTLGVIPARGGSKGVPRKNIRLVHGEPLVARCVRIALEAHSLDRVVVSTDDDEIAAVAVAAGAEVVRRPASIAGDDAPTSAALIHAVRELGLSPTWVVTLEPTSPLRRAETIDRCVQLADARRAGSVVTVRADTGSFGRLSTDGRFLPLDPEGPRRRQDRQPLYAESSTVWVTRAADLIATGNVLVEPVYALVVDQEEAVDINTELDLTFAETILTTKGGHG
jgi:CMP-N,N'-diacetyllegionaminic acid synthase